MKNGYLIVALILLSIVSIFIGVSDVGLSDLVDFSNDGIHILLVSRIPRLISILVAGAGMSISGLIMQQISRNKFVSPTTAATIDSAKMGVLASMIVFTTANAFQRMIVAFIFAIVGTFLFMKILDRIKFKNTIFIPLVGIMLGNIIDSVTTFIAYRFDMVQNISTWLQGDFSMIIRGRYELIILSIPLVFIAYLYANKFTVAGMGEDFAANLGLNYKRVVNTGIGIVALISSLVIITVGRIPFLGLIIPNIVTIFNGDNMKKNIIPTALFGSVFLLIADIIGRVIIYPYEVSISLIVGVVGSVIFLYLLLRRNK